MIERFDVYLPQGVNRKDSKVSPLFATDLADVAPALIVTADHDPLHDEGEEYMTKLRAANVALTTLVCPAWFMALPPWLACDAKAKTSRILDENIHSHLLKVTAQLRRPGQENSIISMPPTLSQNYSEKQESLAKVID